MRPPTHLQQVEQLIGMEFFSDPALEAAARTNPSELSGDEIQARVGLYVAGLRLLAQARRLTQTSADEPVVLKDEQAAQFRQDHSEQLGEIRGMLMTLDPGLEPDAVAALRLVISQLPQPRADKTRPSKPGRPSEILPKDRIPIVAASRLADMSRGSIMESPIVRAGGVPKLKLPGKQSAEFCISWLDLQQLATRHGLRDGVTIVWDKLPRDDTPSRDSYDEQCEQYARKIQLQVVAPHKMSNIPGLDIPKSGPAQSYHISVSMFRDLMGGGYHFAEEFCRAHRIPTFYRINNRGSGGFYMFLEHAAEIMEVYESIPVAEESDMPLVEIPRHSGRFGKWRSQNQDLLTPEEEGCIQLKRALHSKGRVLRHVPGWLAQRIMGRLRHVPLPPHLLPRKALPNLVRVGMRAIRPRLANVSSPFVEMTLVLEGSDKRPQLCFDWRGVRLVLGEDEPRIPIDFDALPRGPNETDPARIAYARHIQAQLVPEGLQIGFSRPIEPIVPPGAVQLPIIGKKAGRQKALSAKAPDKTPPRPPDKKEAATALPNDQPARTAPPVWRPGENLSRGTRRLGWMALPRSLARAGASEGLPEETKVSATHARETAGAWAPAPRQHTHGIISMVQRLTAHEIAKELGVTAEDVDAAITRVKTPKNKHLQPGFVFGGEVLRAVREQLIGVPIEYFQLSSKLTDAQVDRLERHLERRGYKIFNGYISPGAADYVTKNIQTIVGGITAETQDLNYEA